jgi:site-specific DNA recombinase
MTKTIAYLRVSTDKQAEQGTSLESQRDKVLAYAKLYDLDVVDIIVDAGASAKNLEREGLHRALQMLRSGQANALLVTKLDRLTRRVKDLATLIEDYFQDGTYALFSVCDSLDTRTAAGRLVLNVLMSVYQWEREVIVERTKEGMAKKHDKGEFIGGTAPYGYTLADDGKTLVRDTYEMQTVDVIRQARTEGLSQRKVIDRITEQGHVSRNGKPFALAQIQRIMEVHHIA